MSRKLAIDKQVSCLDEHHCQLPDRQLMLVDVVMTIMALLC